MSDPTAPLHQAPDADGRVGAIVGTLAEDLHVLTVTQNPDHGLFWHCKGSGPCWDVAEALAPTVARLMAQAAEEAVAAERARAERAEAQVERVRGLADEWLTAIEPNGRVSLAPVRAMGAEVLYVLDEATDAPSAPSGEVDRG